MTDRIWTVTDWPSVIKAHRTMFASSDPRDMAQWANMYQALFSLTTHVPTKKDTSRSKKKK